jgi:hypothetical protein
MKFFQVGVHISVFTKERGMKQMRRFDCIWSIFAICMLVLLVSWGCGGGGSSSGDAGTGAKAEGSYGKVGILLTDGPADEYAHIWVTITEVSLIPAGSDDGVVIFSSDEGYRFDLLAYQGEDFLLKLSENVPVGKYEKIRLKILKVEAEGGPCNEMEIDVPRGKIDLNAQGSIEVSGENTLYIRLDINANESINLHPAGNSGTCIFRPVVFANIVAKEALSECPSFMKGQVSALQDTNDDGSPESFTLIRKLSCLGSINVGITEDTLIFKEDGTFGCASDIETGQEVTVRGMADDGCIKATLIIIGNILPVCGTVKEPVSKAGFTLEPLLGESILGTVNVVLDEHTPVISGCNTPVDAMKADMHVLMLGKYDMTSRKLFAAVVFVLPDLYSGSTCMAERVQGE